MAKLPQPTRISDFISGMVSDVNDSIVPENSVAIGLNLDFDTVLGSAVSRQGSTIVGSRLSDVGKEILGLYQHIDASTPANNKLFAAVNVDLPVWTVQSASEANNWYAVTYGDGLFVAVSSTGTNRVMTSPDGITWTPQAAAEANQWNDVAYGGTGVFVAVSWDGTNRVMTSPNGTAWTARAAAEANNWTTVTYGNGIFVALSSDGTNQVMTSSNDGATWSPQAAAANRSWSAIAYGNGVFVAVATDGLSNQIMTSTNGIDWVSRSSAAIQRWSSVVYNGIFVAVSQDGGIMTSPDGTTWTLRTAPEANAWRKVVCGSGLFVAVSSDGTNRIMVSTDGITWTSRAAAEANAWYGLATDGTLFVATSIGGTNRVMISSGESLIIKNVATGASVVTGLTANTRVRFLTYGGETLAINGTDAERAWNGASWITSGGVFDLTDFPSSNTASLVIEFLDRIYTNDAANPSRVYYSGLVTGGVVSWGGDYVDIEPESQGGKITAFAKVPGYVLFFKERSLHRWNFSSAFPESLVQVGTPSQESVVQSGGLVFFYSNSSDDARGFYVTNGGRPQCISQDTTRTIKSFIDAIDSANEADIVGVATDRTILWSVGGLTVDGVDYYNVVFKYNRILNQWSIRTYPTRHMVYANYIVNGVNARVAGDNDATIYRIDAPNVYSDNGTKISWKLQTQDETFGTNRLKVIMGGAYVRGKNLNDMSVSIIPDGDESRSRIVSDTSKWYRKLLFWLDVGKNISGTTLAIQLSGSSTDARAVVSEIEIPDIEVKESYE